jgi:hypothetical protein
MRPELGYAATVAALVLASYRAGAAAWSAAKGRGDLRLSSERAAIGVWLLITACMLLFEQPLGHTCAPSCTPRHCPERSTLAGA